MGTSPSPSRAKRLRSLVSKSSGSVATVGCFDAMQIRLVAGRAFDANDKHDETQVIIINETLANRYFGSVTEAVGQRLNVNSPENAVWRPIVGVVRDIKNFGLRARDRNAMYVPFNQISSAFMFTVVRTAGDPLTVASAVRKEIAEVDATIAVALLQPMEDLVFDAFATDGSSTALLTRFAMMGVRIAFGAESSSIRGLVMRRALGLALMGNGAAVLASLVPAVRATRIDPIKILST